MNEDRETRFVWAAVGAMVPLVVAAALVAVREATASANVALVLVAVVVLIAVAGGPDAGAVAALSAAISFAFFHTRPYLHLRISSGDDIETAVLLLLVGLVVGHVASAGRRARNQAGDSLLEIKRVHRVAELLAHGEHPAAVVLAAQAELFALLHLRACLFEAPPLDSDLERLEPSGALPAHRYRFQPDGGVHLPQQGIELPVIGGGRRLARFVLHPRPDTPVTVQQRIAAVAIADQVGAALATPVAHSQSR